MGHVDDGKGGKSAVVDLNIVPIIDLMSVLIVFLLITAVWNQVSMIQLGTSVYGKKTNDNPIEKPERLEVPLRVDVTKIGFTVNIAGNRVDIPLSIDGEYDMEKLKIELEKVKEQYPDKDDAVLAVDDTLEYEAMVKGMDVTIGAGFPKISIATGGVTE